MEYQIKEIPGHKGYYADTNGEIWSAWRQNGDGWIINMKTIHKLAKHKLWWGHLQVRFQIDGVRKGKRVHRLIGKAFIPNPNNLPFVCHENGNPGDNRVGNLYWGTQKENMRDRVKHGTHRRGSRSNTAKLNRFSVERIKLLREVCPTMSQGNIAKIYDVSQSTISSILRGHNWSYSFMPHIH
jgi:hypothetical protein